MHNSAQLDFVKLVSPSYSQAQIDEIEKLVNYIDRMETIIHTSPNRSQVDRVQKELRKMGEKLAAIVPGVNALNVNTNEVRVKVGLMAEPQGDKPSSGSRPRAGSASRKFEDTGLSIIDKFPVKPASPHSTDHDVNFTYTVIHIIQNEYWPVISDQICKLDFSHGAERDSVRMRLDNVLRSMKVLVETIEEYAGAEKQDFREQLLKMKSRQTRIVMFETHDFLKLLRDFLNKLITDIRSDGGVILNKSDTIRFDSRFHVATVLEGRSIADGIKEFQAYVLQAIEKLHIPDLK